MKKIVAKKLEIKKVKVVKPPELREAVQASAPKRVCQDCGDPETIHYGSPDRHCNQSGCRCEALK